MLKNKTELAVKQDLTLFMSHPETKTIEIPFVKKNESDLPKIKLTYFNSTTKKNEDFFIYDFIKHFKKFGFEWNKDGLGLNYKIKIDPTDAKKKYKKNLHYTKHREKKYVSMKSGFGI